MKFFLYLPTGPKSCTLIWDGRVLWPTPFWSDFIDYVKCELPVRDVTKVNTVVGIGMTLHKFTDINGKPVYLPCVSYHLPETDVRLFSPHSEVHSDCIRMLLKTSTIEIQIVREEHNLPVVFDSFASGKAKKVLASNMRSGLCHTRLNALDFFHDNDLGNLGRSPQHSVLGSEHFSNFCGACVGAAENENISPAQKELLNWHWK